MPAIDRQTVIAQKNCSIAVVDFFADPRTSNERTTHPGCRANHTCTPLGTGIIAAGPSPTLGDHRLDRRSVDRPNGNIGRNYLTKATEVTSMLEPQPSQLAASSSQP